MTTVKSSSFVRKQVKAAPFESETITWIPQPAEHSRRPGENFVGSTISPYACGPVAVDIGPGLATYWVPKHLLGSPRWSTTDAGGTLCLPGVSAATGHTLVHYLYTGTYQTLEGKREDAVAPAHINLRQALLTLALASTYELLDLERLAKEQIEKYGSRMALVELLDVVKEGFSNATWSWLHKYVQTRANEQFDNDHTFFTSKAFIEVVGEGALHKFMTGHLLKLFSKKLTHTMQRRESCGLNREEPDALLDVVTHHCHHQDQTDLCTSKDDMSFEFLSVPGEEVDDVISLENYVCDGTSPTPPEPEPVPPPEPEQAAESEPEPVPELESDKEEEEADHKKKEEDAAVLAAAATSAANDLRRVQLASRGEGWDSFAATAYFGKKKKKSKKGKAEPTPPPPPPPPPAEPATTLDDINNLTDDGSLKIYPEVGDSTDKPVPGFELGGVGGWPSGWGSSARNTNSGWSFDGGSKEASGGADDLWYRQKKEQDQFNFDFSAFKGGAAPPAGKKSTEAYSDALGATKTKKKVKKGALIEEPAPERVPEPEPELAALEPKPEEKRRTEEGATIVAEVDRKEDDTWGDWGVAAPTISKKKKKKKGTVDELPPPPPPPPELKSSPSEPQKKEEDDPWAFSFGATNKEKKKKKKGAVEEVSPPLPAEPEPPTEPEAAPEPEPITEEDPWKSLGLTIPKKKKSKKSKEVPRIEEYPPPPPDPEPVFELEPSGPEEKKPADGWGDWGEAAAPVRKSKKKKKGAVEGEIPPPPPEPEREKAPEPEPIPELEPIPEPELTPEPVAEDKVEGGDWGFSSIWSGGNKKKKGKKAVPEPPPPPEPDFAEPLQIEAVVQEPDAGDEVTTEQKNLPELEQEYNFKPKSTIEEAIPEASTTHYPRRCRHLFEGDSWKLCEQCGARIREIMVQLAGENLKSSL